MFVNRIELRFGIEMNPHLTIRNRARFKSPVCRFVRLKFMNRVIFPSRCFWANLAKFERAFIRSFSAGLLWWVKLSDKLRWTNQSWQAWRCDYADTTVTITTTKRLKIPAMRGSYHVTAITTMFGSTVTPMVAGYFSEQGLLKSRTDLSHTVHVNLQG